MHDSYHTDWSELSEISAELENLIERIRKTRGAPVIEMCLASSSALIEHAAFEAAQLEGASNVASLILMAAQLDRMKQGGRPSEEAGRD